MNTLTAVIADDHDLVRSMVANVLRSFGVEVVGEVSNGADAIECAKHCNPDFVIMDGNMPGTNGYEATRAIKASMPDVRVAIVSVADGSMYEQQARLAAADMFITKSSLRESLRELVKGLVAASAQQTVGAAA